MCASPDTGDTALEQRINTEIRTRIDQVLDDAEERAREARDSFVATGGRTEDFMPIIIDVDYEVKCSNPPYLSFVIYKTETLASAYTEIYSYNLDLSTGTELTLPGLLGPDWKARCDQAIRDEMARRTAEEDAVYFTQEQGGFSGVTDDQAFYLDAGGNPVLFFEKYEIAPGSMGIQSFSVPLT